MYWARASRTVKRTELEPIPRRPGVGPELPALPADPFDSRRRSVVSMAMSTRAIQFLNQRRVAYEVVKYDHLEKGAEFAAQAVGFPLSQTIKTLVVALDDRRFALALLPGDCQLSMKKIAAAYSAKRAAMADTQTAERLTGYLVGGISPFGTPKPLPVIMEIRLTACAQVLINGGRRGTMLKMTPADILLVSRGRTADLVH